MVKLSLLFLSTLFAQEHPMAAGEASPTKEKVERALRAGNVENALGLIEAYLGENPWMNNSDRADYLAIKAAALRSIGKNEEALHAISAALRLGLEGREVYIEKARIHESLGQEEEAQEAYEEAEKYDEVKMDFLPKEPFDFWITPKLGFDSNLVGVSDDTLLIEELERDSFYYGATLLAELRLYEEKEGSAALHYQNDLTAYAAERELSFSDNLLSLSLQRRLTKEADLSVVGSYGEAYLRGDDHYRTLRGIRPSLILSPKPSFQLGLFAAYQNLDYYGNFAEFQDPDGDVIGGGLQPHVDFGLGWGLEGTVSVTDYRTEGSDYEHRAYLASVTAFFPEMGGLLPELTLSHVWADYGQGHSLTGFTEARKDRRLALTLSLRMEFLRKLIETAPVISLTYENWSSNINAYDFDRWVPGIEIGFLAFSF